MKKIFITVLMICSVALCFSYSKPKHDESVCVKGYVKVYGNEPFTFIGIVCDSGEEYSLIADENTQKELRKTQGHKIKIKGYKKSVENEDSTVSSGLKDGSLMVIEWKAEN